MRKLLLTAIFVSLLGCQSPSLHTTITILDDEKIVRLQSDLHTPSAIFKEGGIFISPADKILFNGANLPLDFSLPDGAKYTVQIQRAHSITLVTPDDRINFQTTDPTVGTALAATGFQIYASDLIDPPLNTPIISGQIITLTPGRDLTILIGGKTIHIKSANQLIGQALGSAGIPLVGFDYSLPSESESLPLNGQIKVVRVNDQVTLQEKNLPFSKKIEYSVSQAAGEQKVIQSGEPGLAVGRFRIRYEDGKEVARITEAQTVVREPIDNIISLSSQVQVSTTTTPNGQIQYWRAVQMYTTSYSPCRSGTTKCTYGTASGTTVKKGVVAVIPSLFNQLAGSKVYIPGYGIGTIGDVGGGFPDGRLWIDLGFSDDDYQSWSGYHTVYFLAPAPANIPPGLN